ncbi:MAG: transporter, ATPase protein [Verrucomicrobiales bacterium]|nr:transporter, ATPase protein [Verrucomicrobiales bacterium]MDB6131605.1 transporter, ATPase protein [Verrucomicrobiales bacterium]
MSQIETTATFTKPGTLSIQNVSKQFESDDQEVSALAKINLTINPGEFVIFVGPSGCGKSTLLNMIAGFERPSEGTILLDGKQVTKPHNDRLMMFQEHALFPWMNVIDNISYGLRWKFRFNWKKRKQRARELLSMVHLEQFEKASVHQLSGGMKQRVALARALAPDPKILLVDEPFPALDALTRQKLYGDLQELFTRTGKTIVSVTHDTREAACLGDRVVIFSGRPGRIIKEIAVNLPRPRDFNDPEVGRISESIMAELQHEK